MNSPNAGDKALRAAAWDWFLRMRDAQPNDEELAAWLNWYEADERHKAAYDRVQSFWRQSARVAEGPQPLRSPLSLPETADGRAGRLRISYRRYGRVTAAAAIAAGVVLAVMVGGPYRSPPVAATSVAAAPLQLVEQTPLPDGSRVDLAANSSVAVRFDERQRLLALQEGTAYFTVAPNRERPFVVKVGPLYVRAVGTAFNIRRATDRVVVTVTEGTVDIHAGAQPAAAAGAIRVKAGKEITWNDQAPAPTVADADASRALAWREGRLDYFGEPLASAIADLNRYSTRKIIIADAAVGRFVFSGSVLATESDEWLQALPNLFPIEVLADSRGNIVLARRS